MRRRLGLRLVLAIVLACAVLVANAHHAVAAEIKELEPLKITYFSMEMTRATVESTLLGGPEGPEPEITNEPYTPSLSQAGAHPWAMTTTVEFEHRPIVDYSVDPTQEVKDMVVSLPPGLVGNPLAVPRCSAVAALTLGECPAGSQVGVYRVVWLGGKEFIGPIADIVPAKGESAEFALLNSFHISGIATGHLVRRPPREGREGAYELTVSGNGIPAVQIQRLEVTFWGVPGDPSHNPMRGLTCVRLSQAPNNPRTCDSDGGEESGVPPVPFLSLGSNCVSGAETARLRADSWEEPGRYTEETATLPAASGCNLLSFEPTIEAQPDTLVADEPVGMSVDVGLALDEAPESLATATLRDADVTLPAGVSVNSGVADGIRACEATGPEGINIEGALSEDIGPSGELQLAPGDCPDASTLGTAEALTPLLSTPLKGHVYLARPGCGGAGQAPCTEQDAVDGNLYKLYLELGGTGELADTGVHVKLEGRTEANPATGQLTTVFDDSPQTPFSELKVELNGGPRAPLANPAACGPAFTTADFTPWGSPGIVEEGPGKGSFVTGIPDATPLSFYNVDLAGDGKATPCPSLPFKPGFTAETATPQAGQFSAFTLNLSRADREQYVKGIQLHTPPGLLAMLSSVPLCAEAQADAGSCPEASKIGTTTVATGAGSHPFEIEGDVYLTGPYEGAPFGLSVVTQAVAGPFNLGTVVVRGRIDIDREDSTATITFDESGPYAIPQILFGVPLRLQRITADINRAGFMFNPTNCSAESITAKISGSTGAISEPSTPFAVTGCKSLGFKPEFKVSTSAHTSRADGASLDTKLSYPAGSIGSEANIARVKVDLPKQLPSRLTTLQKACPAAMFEANPAACPAASIVGIVRASTPVLPVGLSGPVYFVSHGGEAFPSLIIVLQGDGVRVDLTGATFISKGITSSTFRTVPDVPVGTFELYLPEGRYSALAANGNLCKQQSKLKMPTEFVAQSGLVIKQSTKIAVTGCAKKATGARASARRGAERGVAAGERTANVSERNGR